MADAHISKKTYWTVFALLMILLFLTVFVATIEGMDPTLGIVAAMVIAFVKAGLVVWYFMHVKINSKLTQLFVATGFIFLAILIGITLTDFKTRSWEKDGYQENVDRYTSPYDTPISMEPQNLEGAAAEHDADDEAH